MSLAEIPTMILVPPLNCLLAACVGAALQRRRTGRALLWAGLAGLLLLSLPLVSGTLLTSLQPPPATPAAEKPGAIIILSADEMEVMEAGRATYAVGLLTLARERAGARLAHATGLPILVAGGQIRSFSPTLAALMAASLAADFGVTPRWLENRSQDTWQNAANAAAMLHMAGISRAYVVTSAWHMRRALIAFRMTGLQVVAAPADTLIPPHLELDALIPRVSAWQEGYYALHEWIGCAWYALRA